MISAPRVSAELLPLQVDKIKVFFLQIGWTLVFPSQSKNLKSSVSAPSQRTKNHNSVKSLQNGQISVVKVQPAGQQLQDEL